MNESIIIQIKTNNTKHYDEYEFMLVLCLVIEDAVPVMKGRISGILQQISRQHLEHTRIHIREPFTYHTCLCNTTQYRKACKHPKIYKDVNECFQIN